MLTQPRTRTANGAEELIRHDLREALAAFLHEQWSLRMRYLVRVSTLNDDESMTIPPDVLIRVLRQMGTPYDDLTEIERASARDEADQLLVLLSSTNHART